MSEEKDTRDKNEGGSNIEWKETKSSWINWRTQWRKGRNYRVFNKELQKEFHYTNKQLNNAMKKEDNSITIMLDDIMKDMEDELLKTVIGRIEILEGSVFEKQQENDRCRNKIDS